MDLKSSQNIEIKIILLEINPSLKSLERKNEQISIIFQGINIIYNLRKLLSGKTEILINNCKTSLIVSLLKSDRIFATSLFRIAYGEQWITFNYNSKSTSVMKLNVKSLYTIRMKIKCERAIKNNKILSLSNKSPKNIPKKGRLSLIDSNTHRYNSNKMVKENIFNSNIVGEENKRYRNSLIDGNFNSFNSLNKINSSENIKYSCQETKTRNDIKMQSLSFRNSEMTTFSQSKMDIQNNFNNNVNKDNSYNFNSNKVNDKIKRKAKNQINIKVFNNNKYSHINSSLYSLNNYEMNNYNYYNNYKKKNLTLVEKQIQTLNSKIEQIKEKLNTQNNSSNITSPNSLAISKRNSNISKNLNINPLDNSMNIKNNKNLIFFGFNKNIHKEYKNKSKKIIKNKILSTSNIQSNLSYNYLIATTRKNESSSNSLLSNDLKNELFRNVKKKYQQPLTSKRSNAKPKISHIKSNKSQKYIQEIILNFEKNQEEDELKYLEVTKEDEDIFGNFIKLKNDFISFYNKQYIKNIKDDLLKLEIELFVEKMIGLILVYHEQVEEIKFKYDIEKENYKKNINKYIYLYKLNNRLQLIKDKFKAKIFNLNDNNKGIAIQKETNILLNKKEFYFFENIIYNKKKNNNNDTNKKLKEIIYLILNNQKNKDKIEVDKFKMWLKEKSNFNKETHNNQINMTEQKIRTKVIPKKQKTKIFSAMNNNDKNSFKNNYTNIFDLSIDNKIVNEQKFLNKNLKTEVYRKKTPKSPLYDKKNKLNKNNLSLLSILI